MSWIPNTVVVMASTVPSALPGAVVFRQGGLATLPVGASPFVATPNVSATCASATRTQTEDVPISRATATRAPEGVIGGNEARIPDPGRLRVPYPAVPVHTARYLSTFVNGDQPPLHTFNTSDFSSAHAVSTVLGPLGCVVCSPLHFWSSMTNQRIKRTSVPRVGASGLPPSVVADLLSAGIIERASRGSLHAIGAVHLIHAKRWRVIADLRVPNDLLKDHLGMGPNKPCRQYNVWWLARGPPLPQLAEFRRLALPLFYLPSDIRNC